MTTELEALKATYAPVSSRCYILNVRAEYLRKVPDILTGRNTANVCVFYPIDMSMKQRIDHEHGG